jgi:hypothetical protein
MDGGKFHPFSLSDLCDRPGVGAEPQVAVIRRDRSVIAVAAVAIFRLKFGMITTRAACCAAAVALLMCVFVQVAAPDPANLTLAKNDIGPTRADFEFARTGGGDAGRWTIVRDPTANDGVAIEHVSTDFTEGRFPLAIYNPLSLKNLRMNARFKSVAGTMQSAGLALRVADANNYYVVRASALETRIDLFRVLDGRMERIAGTDADVEQDHWQTLGVSVENDCFSVAFNGKLLFTAWDRSLSNDGRVGLWTEEDNVTRFADLQIEALPWSEEP